MAKDPSVEVCERLLDAIAVECALHLAEAGVEGSDGEANLDRWRLALRAGAPGVIGSILRAWHAQCRREGLL